jgi:flagellar motility protein MotE (MotC chaperone)
MVKNEGAQEYASTLSPEQNYVVDDFNDEELYIYDMKARVPDMTEDELAESLQAAQANPQAFEKQIAGLREEYKRLEEEEIQQEQAINQEQ